MAFAEGQEWIKPQIQRMAEVHSRQGRVPIEPRWYGLWVDVWIATLRDADPQWSAELETAWRRALRPAVDLMIDAY